MPLPIGHTAIAVATYECSTQSSAFASLKRLLFIACLANLPDIDIILGLLVELNAKAFHRGPTHSLAFALIAGWIAWRIAKSGLKISDLGFRHCFYLVLSHVVSDALLTSSRVSFFWPFEIHWSTGTAGWFDVIQTVIFNSIQDLGIVGVCLLIIIANRLYRRPKSLQPSMAPSVEMYPPNKASR